MDMLSRYCTSSRRLDGMVTIVTGCSNGIGLETAKEFYRRGAKVILACDGLQCAQETQNEILISTTIKPPNPPGQLILANLNLSSLVSVRECANKIIATEDKVDILVNNANILTSEKQKTVDGFEMHLGTNLLGHALFTMLLLPKLKQSQHARIVFVSSMIHRYYPLDYKQIHFNSPMENKKAYGLSTSAIILFSKALDIKLRDHNIKNVNTYSVHPGYVNTSIADGYKDKLPIRNELISGILSWLVQSPRSGAQTTIYCAVDESCADESGMYYSKCAPAPCAREAQDPELAMKLYEETVKALGLGNYNPFTDEITAAQEIQFND